MINYSGTFKVLRQIVDWINNFNPVDEHFEVKPYTDINGDTVNALYQKVEVEDESDNP
jgi:hypothetical protein